MRSLEAQAGNQAALSAAASRLHLWDDLTVPQRKELLRQFLERVTAHREPTGIVCEVVWHQTETG
jgi:acyl-CoA reductase-like NAD-dependent aldehyde dehydrogenase